MSEKPSEPANNRKGRPAIGKRGSFSFRTTEALREKLSAAAAASQRSVSEEIEHRLERTFEADRAQAMSEDMPLMAESRVLLSRISKALRAFQFSDEFKDWSDNDAASFMIRMTLYDIITKFTGNHSTKVFMKLPLEKKNSLLEAAEMAVSLADGTFFKGVPTGENKLLALTSPQGKK